MVISWLSLLKSHITDRSHYHQLDYYEVHFSSFEVVVKGTIFEIRNSKSFALIPVFAGTGTTKIGYKLITGTDLDFIWVHLIYFWIDEKWIYDV